MTQQLPDFKNILVIHFGQLGDVVLSLPALGAIRDKFANAKITLLVGKSAAEVVEIAGVADEHIAVDRVMLRDGNKLRSIATIIKLVGEVKKRRFDFAIDLHSLYETNLLGFLAGIKYRLYANRENRSLDFLANFSPKPPVEDKSKHVADRYCDVLRALSINIDRPTFRFQHDIEDIDFVCRRFFFHKKDRLVGIFPGAGHSSRRWSLSKFADLAARLSVDGLRPVVFLGPEEVEIKPLVIQTFPKDTILVDDVSIRQFIAAATRLDALVTNDTGPMHLAACAGAPIALLIDARAPTTYLPLSDKLMVIQNATMDLISVDDVYHEFSRFLSPNDKTNVA